LNDEKPRKAKTTQLTAERNISCEDKVSEDDNGLPVLRLCVGMPARCNDAEHRRYRACGTRRALRCGAAPGVIYLDLRRLPKLRRTPGAESPYDRHPIQRRWYVHHPLQHGEHRGECFR